MPNKKTIHVRYFALLRDESGKSEEMIETSSRTPFDLYAELSSRYKFSLTVKQLRVAVNDSFSSWQIPLKDGDRLVFIPPVSGG